MKVKTGLFAFLLLLGTAGMASASMEAGGVLNLESVSENDVMHTAAGLALETSAIDGEYSCADQCADIEAIRDAAAGPSQQPERVSLERSWHEINAEYWLARSA